MMIEAVFVQGLFKIFLGVIGIVMGRVTLKMMDSYIEKSNNSFSQWFKGADNVPKAIYYSGRLIFVAIIIGAALS